MKTAIAQLLKPTLAKLTTLAVVILSLAWPAHVWASVYGCGSYNSNTYNNSCTSAGSTSTKTPAASDQTQTTTETPTTNNSTTTTDNSTEPSVSAAAKHQSLGDLIFKKYKWLTFAFFSLMVLAGIFWFILLARRRRRDRDSAWTIPPGTP